MKSRGDWGIPGDKPTQAGEQMRVFRWPQLCIALIAVNAFGTTMLQAAESQTYHPPKPLPFVLSADTATLAELLSKPATRAVLQQVDPELVNDAFARYLGYYTVPQMRNFLPKAVTPANIAKINAALAKLPRSEWPVQ
jgi:hypothetical protein